MSQFTGRLLARMGMAPLVKTGVAGIADSALLTWLITVWTLRSKGAG
jgi:hypothetical protein